MKKVSFILGIILMISSIVLFYKKIYIPNQFYDQLLDEYQLNHKTNIIKKKENTHSTLVDKKKETIDMREYSCIELEETTENNLDNITFDINMSSLMKTYPDVVGYIYVPNTKINYPIVQTTNNDKYLNTLINGKSSSHGSIFIDYRNQLWDDDIYLIYGHSMKDGSMFKGLYHYLKKDYYKTHKDVYLYKGLEKYKCNIIGVVLTDNNNPIYTMNKNTIKDNLKHNCYDIENVYDDTKEVFVLSTCYKHTQRIIVLLQIK